MEGEKGINIVFDSLPLPDAEGRVSVSLFKPRDNSGNGQRQQGGGYGGGRQAAARRRLGRGYPFDGPPSPPQAQQQSRPQGARISSASRSGCGASRASWLRSLYASLRRW
ncbi:hypothetical protein AB5I41_01690 [Sphingomonas sp. MMS24-JH45]